MRGDLLDMTDPASGFFYKTNKRLCKIVIFNELDDGNFFSKSLTFEAFLGLGQFQPEQKCKTLKLFLNNRQEKGYFYSF